MMTIPLSNRRIFVCNDFKSMIQKIHLKKIKKYTGYKN